MTDLIKLHRFNLNTVDQLAVCEQTGQNDINLLTDEDIVLALGRNLADGYLECSGDPEGLNDYIDSCESQAIDAMTPGEMETLRRIAANHYEGARK